ncbi:isochorismatase family protein [bacterium]|nr:isochorismatase family protein [bacterium]
MLSAENSLVLVIDIQEKLVKALEKDTIISKASKIVEGARILDIPVLFTEQYPKGLGKTVAELQMSPRPYPLPMGEGVSVNEQSECYTNWKGGNVTGEVIEKTYFNALLEEGFLEKIKSYGKKQIVIMGIETHICVYQTACALVDEGFEVYAIKDACASRNKYEFKQGIESMKDNGVKISCVEIALFEWLKGSKHPKFKEVQALIK